MTKVPAPAFPPQPAAPTLRVEAPGAAPASVPASVPALAHAVPEWVRDPGRVRVGGV